MYQFQYILSELNSDLNKQYNKLFYIAEKNQNWLKNINKTINLSISEQISENKNENEFLSIESSSSFFISSNSETLLINNIETENNISSTSSLKTPNEKRNSERHVSFETPNNQIEDNIDNLIPSPLSEAKKLESDTISLNESDISSDENNEIEGRSSIANTILNNSFQRISDGIMKSLSDTNLILNPNTNLINNKMKFQDSDSLRLSIDRESLLISRNSLCEISPIEEFSSELTEQANQFKKKWLEIVKEREQLINKNNINFEEEINSSSEFEDDEIIKQVDDNLLNNNNIPTWVKPEILTKLLIQQSKIDPDTIFLDFHPTCALTEVFNNFKPQWQLRNESQKWDEDGLTVEEISKFKKAIGLS